MDAAPLALVVGEPVEGRPRKSASQGGAGCVARVREESDGESPARVASSSEPRGGGVLLGVGASVGLQGREAGRMVGFAAASLLWMWRRLAWS